MKRTSNRKPALLFAAFLLVTGLASAAQASGRLQVVASINDLASIAASVGGEDVEVAAIARATSDVHRVEVLPSYMVRVARAKVYLKVGLALDQWADQIIDGSRNTKLAVIDCSCAVTPLDKPVGRVDGRGGDVHPDGNPHLQTDPRRLLDAAHSVTSPACRQPPTTHAVRCGRWRPRPPTRGRPSWANSCRRTCRRPRCSCGCLLYTSPSPRDGLLSRMPSSA